MNLIARVVPAALFAALPAMAAPADHGPTPGLYRISDFTGSQVHKGPNGRSARVDLQRDGNSGDERTLYTGPDGKQSQRSLRGTGPETVCVAKFDRNAVLPDMGANSCKGAPATRIANGWVASSTCPFADMKITMVQVNDKTWRYDILTTMKQQSAGGASSQGMGAMEAVLKNMLKNGTDAEKKEAREMLAQMPKMKADAAAADAEVRALGPVMDEARKEAAREGITLPPANDLGQFRGGYTMTRIADSCPAKTR
jgi:hypothetical protein